MPSVSTRRPVMWHMFHLIRSIWVMKGLCMGLPGHMAHNRERMGVVAIL